MGDNLYDTPMKQKQVWLCTYAPVGPHRDLLPYLVPLRTVLTRHSFISYLMLIHLSTNCCTSAEAMRKAGANDKIPLPAMYEERKFIRIEYEYSLAG